MSALILNFINGNLTRAQEQAKHFSAQKIRDSLIDDYGFSFEKAQRTAEYLKGKGSFQAACDTE